MSVSVLFSLCGCRFGFTECSCELQLYFSETCFSKLHVCFSYCYLSFCFSVCRRRRVTTTDGIKQIGVLKSPMANLSPFSASTCLQSSDLCLALCLTSCLRCLFSLSQLLFIQTAVLLSLHALFFKTMPCFTFIFICMVSFWFSGALGAVGCHLSLWLLWSCWSYLRINAAASYSSGGEMTSICGFNK